MAENETTRDEIARPDEAHSPDARTLDSRKMLAAARKEVRLAERATRKTDAKGSRRFTPVRAVGTLAAVCALIAGVAIPAYAATQQDESGATAVDVRDVAEGEAQAFEASADVTQSSLDATTYSATSAEEIEKIEAEREAVKRAKEQQRQAEEEAQRQEEAAGVPAGIPADPAAPAAPAAPPASSGGATMPLPGGYTVGQSLGSGRGHEGLDLLTATGTPIYAVHDCSVVSSGWSGAYGNLVTLSCNVDGSQIEIRNGHMTSTAVSVGQTVSAGQVIGYVGSTGRSTAPHLHIEIRINGGLIDPLYYLPM
ncbi:M23 family metallopeptidase [Microbacterium sp. G2-8]|uniref:M23 family metallopeptidase n=1 Tax=Microbacterium sp. G2-8 TaxID=2842454 RepID=UPI001C8A019F|nr:M23 family metallopeptidase [Microbacterium sp. G2-8]